MTHHGKHLGRAWIAAAWLAIGAAALPAAADVSRDPQSNNPAEPPAARSDLDDELLRSLGLDEPPPAKSKPAQPAPGGEQPGQRPAGGDLPPPRSELDEQLLRELGGAAERRDDEEPDDGNPLMNLSRRMRTVEQQLRAARADGQTREMQERIVRDLEELIKQIQQQRQQQQQSSSASSGRQQTAQRERVEQPQMQDQQQAGRDSQQPARDSADRAGPPADPEKPDPGQMQDLLKNVWGELPPRLRQQMLQSSMEQFLPKYELLIEEYFKTLVNRRQQRSYKE